MADTKTTSPAADNVTPTYTVRDFGGMQPCRDPHDVQPGKSVHQLNCGGGPAGELRVRLGAAVVRFRG